MLKFILSALFGVFALECCAQEPPSELLNAAAQCLVTSKLDWLGLNESPIPTLSLGSELDMRSYPGEKHFFVVAFTGNHKGFFFDFKVDSTGAKLRMTIENNAAFVHSRKGITFVEPPLGGVWTTEHLKAAVKQIELGSRIMLSTDGLRKKSQQVECRSYADSDQTTTFHY